MILFFKINLIFFSQKKIPILFENFQKLNFLINYFFTIIISLSPFYL
jgi:hypothetical protein